MKKIIILITFVVLMFSVSCIKVYHEEVKPKTKQQIVEENYQRQETGKAFLFLAFIVIAPFGLIVLFSEDNYGGGVGF